MDELVTLEETDGGSDILLVVPKATVLQVRTEQQSSSWAGEWEGSMARDPFSLYAPLGYSLNQRLHWELHNLAIKKVSI